MVRLVLAPMEFGMTKDDMFEAGQRLKRKKPDVIGLTEMRTTWMKTQLMDGLGKGYKMVVGGECPIIYNTSTLELVTTQTRCVTKGVGPDDKGNPGITPDLPITTALFRVTRNNKAFRVRLTHMVPLSLNGRRRKDRPDLRQELWDAHWDQLVKDVRSDVGPEIDMGDFNNRWLSKVRIKRTFPRMKLLVNNGIDKIWCLPSKKFTHVRTWTVNTGSDHLGRGVTLWIR